MQTSLHFLLVVWGFFPQNKTKINHQTMFQYWKNIRTFEITLKKPFTMSLREENKYLWKFCSTYFQTQSFRDFEL